MELILVIYLLEDIMYVDCKVHQLVHYLQEDLCQVYIQSNVIDFVNIASGGQAINFGDMTQKAAATWNCY